MSASKALPNGWSKIIGGNYAHTLGRVWREGHGKWYARRRQGAACGPFRTMLDAMAYVETGQA